MNTAFPAGSPEKFVEKTSKVLSFLWIWAALAAVHILFFTVIRQEPLKHESRKLAWRKGVLPAVRGSILSENGIPLAETRLVYRLLIAKNTSAFRSRKIIEAVTEKLGLEGEYVYTGKTLSLVEGISPGEIRKIRKQLQQYPELQIVPEHRRIVTGDPLLREKTGKTDRSGHGISGWEKEYDRRLSGKDGSFTVMLDRSGRWVPGSVRMIREPMRGENISPGKDMP